MTFLDGITVEEFDYIEALYSIRPFGDRREDMRVKRMTQAIAGALGVTVDLEQLDYLDDGSEEAIAAPQSVEANIANVARAFGAIRL